MLSLYDFAYFLLLMKSNNFLLQDNFVIGNTKKTAGLIYLIDFGLCKRLPIQDGKVVKVLIYFILFYFI
jgi:hypothetical protein